MKRIRKRRTNGQFIIELRRRVASFNEDQLSSIVACIEEQRKKNDLAAIDADPVLRKQADDEMMARTQKHVAQMMAYFK